MPTTSLPTALLALLLPLVSSHFTLTYPAVRGFNEDTLDQFPCGGQNAVSSNRTLWPTTSAPIQLNMGHTDSRVQVLLALGNDPGDSFNVVLVPTFQEQGPRDFCIGGVSVPPGLNVTEGMNATIQVVTNGDPAGGLYNCADITFTSTPLSTEQYDANCRNSTGVRTSPLSGAQVNANQSSESSSSPSGTSSGTASGAAASATSTGLAAQATFATWALGAAGVLGGLAVL